MANETLDEMAFEEALAELETIVQKLEGGTLTLEDTVSLYERGRELAKRCQQLLDSVDIRLQQLSPDGAGGTVAVPLAMPE